MGPPVPVALEQELQHWVAAGVDIRRVVRLAKDFLLANNARPQHPEPLIRGGLKCADRTASWLVKLDGLPFAIESRDKLFYTRAGTKQHPPQAVKVRRRFITDGGAGELAKRLKDLIEHVKKLLADPTRLTALTFGEKYNRGPGSDFDAFYLVAAVKAHGINNPYKGVLQLLHFLGYEASSDRKFRARVTRGRQNRPFTDDPGLERILSFTR